MSEPEPKMSKQEERLRERSFSDVSMGFENVTLADAVREVRNAREEVSNVFLSEQGKNKTEIVLLKIKLKKVEVRVREEMEKKFWRFLRKHELMFFGCDCSDCKIIEDDYKERFLVKSEVHKE